MSPLLPPRADRYVLTLQDLDAPAPVAEGPDLPALLAAARAEGFAAGEQAGRRAALGHADAAAATALRDAADALARGTEAAAAMAERNAGTLAAALFAALAAALPSLATRLAEAEVARFAATLLPSLAAEPRIVLSAAPALVPALAARFAAEPRIEVHADPALAPGDTRIAWRDGEAERRAEEAREAVTALLTEFGLA